MHKPDYPKDELDKNLWEVCFAGLFFIECNLLPIIYLKRDSYNIQLFFKWLVGIPVVSMAVVMDQSDFATMMASLLGLGRKQRNNSPITSQFMSWSSKLPKACQPFEVHLGTLNQTWVQCCCTLPLMIKWWKYMYELFLRICSYGDMCWVTNIVSKRFVIDTHLLAVLILQW